MHVVGFFRFVHQPETCLTQKPATLPIITRGTARNHVVPAVETAAR